MRNIRKLLNLTCTFCANAGFNIVTNHNHSNLNKRVLKINVGFLLAAGPGNSHDSHLDIPQAVQVSDDLLLTYIQGPMRLTRAKEGILVQGTWHIGLFMECPRCLDEFEHDLTLNIEELYMHPSPIDSEFSVGADGNLDLAPLVRAETIIASGHPVLCQANCKGLCPQCGTNLNNETCHCEVDTIDPRMAKLRELLDASDGAS
jgi:uncharacterized protein